jgi:polysaccharide pyruvyl transferase WcaK-like protein
VPYTDVTGDLNWSMWTDALRKIGVQSLIRDCHDAQKKLRIPINNGDILEQISASDIIVAMRFHMIVAASMMGVLTIPIN